jgi:protein-S-isoprenylcysteine O-methyltransferase Ste14
VKSKGPVERIGSWLFRCRGYLPVPFLLAALYITQPLSIWTGFGTALILVGQLCRLWGVSHIGPASRSRTVNAAKLTYTGPYELTRNPLYMANIIMFSGVSIATGNLLFFVFSLVGFSVYFHFIVLFEESYLETRLGEIYRSYRNRVPRWLGEAAPVHAAAPKLNLDERITAALRSERSTFIASASIITLLVFRAATSG